MHGILPAFGLAAMLLLLLAPSAAASSFEHECPWGYDLSVSVGPVLVCVETDPIGYGTHGPLKVAVQEGATLTRA